MGQTSSRLLRGRRSSTTDQAVPSPSPNGSANASRPDESSPATPSMTDPSGKGKGRASQAQEQPRSSIEILSQTSGRSARQDPTEAASSSKTDDATTDTGSLGSQRLSRPRLFSKQSKQSSNSSGSTVRPSTVRRRTTSSRSIATVETRAGSDGSSTPTSPSRERRNLLDRFKQRRFSSFIGSEDLSTPSTAASSEEADQLSAQHTSPVPSLAGKETPLAIPYEHAALPVTPPEESDAILQERQRVRDMIEAAGISLRPSHQTDREQEQEAASEQATIVIRPPTVEDDLDPPERIIPIMASPRQSTTSESVQTPQVVSAESSQQNQAEAVPIITGSLPTESTTVPAASVDQPLQQPALSNSAPDSRARTSPAARPPATGLPRRILVQGIVSRSLSPRPLASSTTAPTSRLMSPEPTSASGSSSEDTAEEPENLVPPGDSGFWNELVEGALSPEDSPTTSHSDDTTGSSAWDEAVAELLALPSEEGSTDRHRASQEDSAATTVGNGDPHPGTIIGRLLGIAAASTAATLLPPGSIVINGQVVPGFDDNDDSAALAVGGNRPSNARSRSRSASAVVSSARSHPNSPRSTTISPTRPPYGQARQSSGSLQTILQDALASAFRSPTASAPASPSQSTSPLFSPVPDSSTGSEPLSSRLPVTNASPVTSPLATPPLSPRPSGRVPTMAIPIPDWSAEGSLAHGRSQPAGTFERFLADLQTDIVPAVLRYLIELDRGASPDRFVFFRSFRFSARPATTFGPEGALAASGIPVPVQQGPNSPTDPAALMTPAMAAGVPNEPSSQPADTQAVANTPAPPPNLVPMLLVGVRSIARLDNGDLGSETLGGQDLEPTDEEEIDPVNVSLPLNEDEEGDFSAAQVPLPVDSDDVGFGAPGSAVEAEETLPGAAPAESADDQNRTAAAAHSGFMMWIMGGVYPENHPLVIAPNLLSDEALSYDEMLRLAEILGSVKPPTATQDEIKKSTLPVIKGSQVRQSAENNEVLAITADRCLVCLEDYEDDEDIRILKCKHCFHQPCVDRWLAEGANTCPACRTEGVEKEATQQAAATSIPVTDGQVNAVQTENDVV